METRAIPPLPERPRIMRALGPGSVSSFLKVILDVVNLILWIAGGAITLGALAVLLLSFEPEVFRGTAIVDRYHLEGRWLGPAAAAVLVGSDLYFAGSIVIVGRLRRIFQTLVAGDPFHPDNVRRLRVIGATMAALEVGRYIAAAVFHLIFRGHAALRWDGGISLTAWFSVLVVVVLAEVFREGARLRGEAELTI
jgi:hypothetical protein